MIRLAHVVTHPIQYFAPLYRALSDMEDIDLTVLFCSEHGVKPSFDAGFGMKIQFDVPLLDGYKNRFLKNRGPGGTTGKYWNFDCPQMYEALVEGAFDALWVHGWAYKAQWQAFRSARRLGIPLLVRGENTPSSTSKSFLRRMARTLLLGQTLRNAAACLYVGNQNRQFFRDLGVRDERLFPSHYSVDTTQFVQQSLSRDRVVQLRQRYGTSAEDFVLVIVAKLIPLKRVQDAILACGKLGQGARLWVIGEGPERSRLEAIAQKHAPGQVYWHGFLNQSQLPPLLSAADVFLLLSEGETWGLVVNEAMACGLPAVCSDRVGCAADLIREGMTGFVYPVGQVEELAARLRSLRSNREQTRKMGEAARELVLRDYDVYTTARQIAAAARACCTAAV